MRATIVTAAAVLFSSSALAGGIFDNSANYGSILQDRDKPAYDTASQHMSQPVPYPVLQSTSSYGSVINDVNGPSRVYASSSQPAVGDVTELRGGMERRETREHPIFQNHDNYGSILNDL